MQQSKGFTLIELMIVIAIVAIVAAIAIPAYTEQVRKGRRAEAVSALGDLQLRQERRRAENPTFGTLAQLGVTSPLPSGFYSLAIDTPSGTCDPTPPAIAASNANSYRITATAAGAQASDSKCATMVLTSFCGAVTKTSTPAGERCWH